MRTLIPIACGQHCEAATAAVADVENELGLRRKKLDRCEHAVAAAVDALLQGAIAPLFEEAQTLQARLIDARVILRHLIPGFRPRAPHFDGSGDPFRECRQFLRNNNVLCGTIGSVEPYTADWDRHPAVDPWRDVRKALAQDADAPLPTMGDE